MAVFAGIHNIAPTSRDKITNKANIMKNQHFGDINDYVKYGLLRLLLNRGEMKTAICWMLTLDDGRTDGRLTSYLNKPEKWRQYDPGLYDVLKHLVVTKGIRNVQMAESCDISPHHISALK